MKTENASNEASSATTSHSAPADKDKAERERIDHAPQSSLSEADYLTRQADDAMDALKHTLAKAKNDLLEGVNPVEWAKEHPWITIGATATVGIVAAAVLIPSKESRALKRLEKIEAALNAGRHHHNGNGNGDGSAHSAAGHGILGTVLKEGFKLLQPVLAAAISSGVATAAARKDEDQPDDTSYQDGNG